MVKVTVFDTETSGLIDNPARRLSLQPEIISIAIADADLSTGVITNKYYKIFCPEKPVIEKITKITGLTNEMLRKEPSIFIYLDEIIARLSCSPLIIGQNVTFDRTMVNIECTRYKKEMYWPKTLDLVENSIYIKGYRLSLTNLHIELFGESFDKAHDAMADVEATIRCASEMHKRGWL